MYGIQGQFEGYASRKIVQTAAEGDAIQNGHKITPVKTICIFFKGEVVPEGEFGVCDHKVFSQPHPGRIWNFCVLMILEMQQQYPRT